MSDNIKAKDLFVKNKIENLIKLYSIPIILRDVLSLQSSADLITCLTLEKNSR